MKKELEITLEKLEGFKRPNIKLEQYVTPPSLAAEIVVNAYLMSDLKYVVDLGCGTGMLTIASSLFGARAVGVDIDRNALFIARNNSKRFDLNCDFIRCDINKLELRKKDFTVIMNPPFGIHKKHADRPFLLKAMEISRVIYSIHSAGSDKFIKKCSEDNDFKITHLWYYSIPLRRTYEFHEKEFKHIPVEVYRMERKYGDEEL